MFGYREPSNRAAKYATGIALAHLLVNIVHGIAHRELHVGQRPPGSVFVIVVVLILPLLAMALVWTTEKRLGLILLSLSMFGSLLFGLHHHFLATCCSLRKRLELTSVSIFSGSRTRAMKSECCG